jgi:hypothetical protein
MLLTRAIGPNNYGVYVGALGVQTYLYAVTQLGLVVFLVRHGEEVSDAQFDQAFTLLGAIGVSVATIVYFALPIVEGWIGIQAFAAVGRALVIVLPDSVARTGAIGTARARAEVSRHRTGGARRLRRFLRRRASAGEGRISRVGACRRILGATGPHDRDIVRGLTVPATAAVESAAHSRDGGLRRELLRCVLDLAAPRHREPGDRREIRAECKPWRSSRSPCGSSTH